MNATTAPHVVTGRVRALVAGTPNVVYIEDPNGDFLDAITAGGSVTVFAHCDATLNGSHVHTAGRWAAAPSHSSGTTTFTAADPGNTPACLVAGLKIAAQLITDGDAQREVQGNDACLRARAKLAKDPTSASMLALCRVAREVDTHRDSICTDWVN